MNLAAFALKRRTTTLVLTAVAIFGGFQAFEGLGRLEDPAFTIKDAIVFTPYPGATPGEVEQEVTDKIEIAIQSLGQLREVRSISRPGLSIVYANIQDQYDRETLPQVWDELRRKVGDIQSQLPPGAGPSVVNDDFGDVYGIFLALTGEGYSYAELWDVAKMLKKELLLCTDVARIEFWGNTPEVIYVEMSRARLSQLGISPQQVYNTLGLQNAVVNAGRIHVGDELIRVEPTGLFTSVDDLSNLLIPGGQSGAAVSLRDVAEIKRGFQDPPSQIMEFNGESAIGIGISTRLGGNVVTMGESVEERLAELEGQIPIGMELGVVSFQSRDVVKAIDGFMVNLVMALAIVIGVLLIFMGLRSAILIALALLITIAGTFIPMSIYGVSLERISLGALIIALGMLVDNAIVVTEGMLIGSQQGKSRAEAAIETVGKQAIPLLGATAVAILAFAAIGASQDASGEFCRSLFQVILFSLGLSWVFAVTSVPLLGTMILKEQKAGEGGDLYKGRIFQLYRRVLQFCVDNRWLTLAIVAGVFFVSLWGFGFIDNLFFPDSTRPQFYLEYWRPEGGHIRDTAHDVAEIDEWIHNNLEGVTSTATFTGQGAMRFMLTYAPEDVNSSYGMVVISVEDYRIIPDLIPQIEQYVRQNYPDSESWCRQFPIGPGKGAKIEAMFMGPDRQVLRQLTEQAKEILRDEPGAINIRDDWRHQVKIIEPLFSETQARAAGVTRPDVAGAVEMSFEGRRVGLYREEDDLLPIIARAPEEERSDVFNLNSVTVWSSGSGRAVPFSQVVPNVRTDFEDNIIRRMNRKRALKAQADHGFATPEAIRLRVAPKIEAIELPPGYEFEWRGEKYDSTRAQTALAGKLPMTIGLMVLIVILLFDKVRQPAIIWLTVPLALIGVVLGLLVTGKPFGFMALLGFLSLSGMLIKNAIVLIDETDGLISSGMAGYDAVIQAGVSRARPVMMASLTTMLGMIPLFTDAFFVAMAVTIVFGLGVASFLTLLVVPTLYATLFKIHKVAG